MKLKLCILAALLLATPCLYAMEDDPTPQFTNIDTMLSTHAAVLNSMPQIPQTKECSDRYQRIYNDKQLSIDYYLGYIDSGNRFALDRGILDSLMKALVSPCLSTNHHACDFEETADLRTDNDGPIVLTKMVATDTGEREVQIRLWTSAVYNNHLLNTNGPGRFITTKDFQKQKSKNVAKSFRRSLGEADVVIYDGHSRHGSGPGFKPFGVLEFIEGTLFKPSWGKMKKSLKSSKQDPEVIAFLSCKSRKYYYRRVREVAPNSAIVASEKDSRIQNGVTSGYGLIDSLIAGRCSQQINQALHPAEAMTAVLEQAQRNGGDTKKLGIVDEGMIIHNFDSEP